MYLPVNVILFKYVNLLILWNYFYLWGSILVSSQNFPGSLGDNFVGGIIGIPLINIKQRIVYTFMASYICEQRLTSESHEHWSGTVTNNGDSTVC